jgi:hypothetical protein
MDETYIKVKGEWGYLYRAVDSHGDTLDFMLSERRDEEAATAFFKQAINNNGILFYENWKRRGNYLKNHLDLRQNRKYKAFRHRVKPFEVTK